MTLNGKLNRKRLFGLSGNTILFYLVVPSLIGIVFVGLSRGDSTAWPLYLVQSYSLMIVILGWFIKDWFCALAAKLLRPRGLPLTGTLVLGAAVAHVVIFPFNIGFQTVFEYLFVPEDLHDAHRRWQALSTFSPEYYRNAVLIATLPAIFLWATTSLVFFHILGMPRYGYPPSRLYLAIYNEGATKRQATDVASVAHTNSPQPSFMDFMPSEKRNERIIAIKAEQHYVRVYTPAGETLIHERFRSAIAEFERAGGVQVHRSFAVNPELINSITVDDGQYRISMANGLDVPVSRSYRAIAKQLMHAS